MRRSIWLAGFLGASLALGACGGGSGTARPPSTSAGKTGTTRTVVAKDAVATLVASVDATASAKTARISGRMTISSGTLLKPLSFRLEGKVSLDGRSGVMTMDMSSLLSMLPNAPDTLVVEARLVDGVSYFAFRDFFTALAGGKALPPSLQGARWLKLDLTQAGTGSSPASFTQYLEYLRGVSAGKVKTVGRATVRGVATTRYSAAIDPAEAVARLDPSSPLGRLAAASVKQVVGELQVDVWIGDDGYVRRMRVTGTSKAQGQTATADMTMDLYDFGVAVDVQAPPVAEVRDFSELALFLGGAGT